MSNLLETLRLLEEQKAAALKELEAEKDKLNLFQQVADLVKAGYAVRVGTPGLPAPGGGATTKKGNTRAEFTNGFSIRIYSFKEVEGGEEQYVLDEAKGDTTREVAFELFKATAKLGRPKKA